MTENTDSRPVPPVTAERDGSGPSAELTTDELFHTLQSERRRSTLRHLLDAEGPVDVETLAASVAATEQSVPVDEVPDEVRQRTYLDLYGSQLPKLDALDLVDHDRERDVAEPTPAIELFAPYLDEPLVDDTDEDAAPDREPETDAQGDTRSWAEYYAVTSLASVGLVGVAALGSVSPLLLSFRAVAGLVTAMHVVLTGALILSTER